MLVDDAAIDKGISEQCFEQLKTSRVSYVIIAVESLSNTDDVMRLVDGDDKRFLSSNDRQTFEARLLTATCAGYVSTVVTLKSQFYLRTELKLNYVKHVCVYTQFGIFLLSIIN